MSDVEVKRQAVIDAARRMLDADYLAACPVERKDDVMLELASALRMCQATLRPNQSGTASVIRRALRRYEELIGAGDE